MPVANVAASPSEPSSVTQIEAHSVVEMVHHGDVEVGVAVEVGDVHVDRMVACRNEVAAA